MSSDPVTLNLDNFTPFDSGVPVEAASNLRQSLAYGLQQNPDEYAKLLKQQQVTGMSPQVAAPAANETQNAIDLEKLNPEQMAVTHPRTAGWASNPDNAAVSGADDIERLKLIEQRAQALRQGPGDKAWAEIKSAAGNVNASFFGAFRPLIDAAGAGAQALWETPKPLMAGIIGADPDFQALRGVWTDPRSFKVQGWTDAAQKWLSAGVIPEEPQYLTDPETGKQTANPGYRWYGRGLVNALEQVPGALSAFALTGKLAGVSAETAGADAAASELESQTVPALLGTESAQTTYAQARAKGADQKTAIAAALAAGLTNYGLMGRMPGAVSPATVKGAIAQWAARSATLGTAMTAADNAIARGYDPDRGLMEGWQQSIATMAAFEGVGAISHITDAVEASKLRARSPEKFDEAMQRIFEGDESLRVPAQDFVNYFQGRDIDPAEIANRVGVTNLEEAAAAGSDLEIPKANFFSRLDPEHQKGLLPDIIDPETGLSGRQAEASRKELEDWVGSDGAKKLAAEYAEADAETQATPEWQTVYSDLRQRYVDAGESEAAADSYAELHANVIANLARKAGLKPNELLALHNPRILVGNASEPDEEHEAVLNQDGNFGPVHDEFFHNAQGAVEQLLKDRGGEAVAALHHPDVGDIDLIYGKEGDPDQNYRGGYGLAKIAAKHPEVLDDLQGLIDGMTVRERDKERVHLESPDGRAAVSLTWHGKDKSWLLTAFRREEGASPAAESGNLDVADRAEPAPTPEGQEAGNAQESSVAPNDAEVKPDGRTLYQSSSDSRHERNRELAKIQGEILTGGRGKRGWFRVTPDGRYEIGKTRVGDFSTFVHEPAHAYLELFRELTQREGASQPLKDDFSKICTWLGTTPDEAYKNGFTREQHEKWAEANEQYVREGKAPTAGLRRAFHNFAVWLGSIYRRASALGVELDGEIRGVMDRLYAGEDAVNRAESEEGEPLFQNPEDAGWTEAEYRNYAEAKGIAVDKAREQVQAELNEAAVRERTQQWREEKGNVRDAVTAEIDARPEYRAIRSLRKGQLDDGTELTLNRDALVKQFGEDRVKALQRQHPMMYRADGGVDAETAAELLGFNSGEEMMRALESAPRRAQAIEAATRSTMTARHGDVRYDGSLDDKARLALENQERAKGLHTELAALRRKVAALERKAADARSAMASITVEPLEHYQEAARQIVDGKAVADLQPYRYLNASRKFSRQAFDALRRGDVRAAADAKNKELLNHFLFREASAARDYVDKFESYAKRVQSRGIQQRLGLADENAKREGRVGDYRDQFNWLMARYRLAMPPAAAPGRSLREWANAVFGQGNDVAIAPGILNEGRFVDYRSAPLSEIRDLHEALTNIRHLALQEFKMYVQGKQVDFGEAKKSMIEAARTNLKTKPETVFDENRSRIAKFFAGLKKLDSRLIRMERLIEWLDGGKTGPWHDNLWNLASDAQGDEYRLQEKVTRTVTDALADMPAETRRRLWTEKVSVEGVGEPLTRRRMLSIAFNMGNEGNLDRLRKTFISFGWDPDAIRRIGGMLTREEWEFVQKTWESLKPLGERMKQLEQRLTGLPPAMVKVTPFKVALDDGTEMDLAGGYYPIAMDPRFSQRAIEQDSKESAQNAMQAGYVRATTSKGYTKERTGFGGPLVLDYEQVLTSHVAKVSKDLSHREFMLASQRLLLDTEVRKALRETLGLAYEQQFMPWLRTIINDNNGSVQERLDGLKDQMQRLRGNIVAASLGFNASTSLLQISHAPRMLLYAKTSSLAQAFVDMLAHPLETSQEVRDLSPNEMRFRGDNLDRDIRAVLQNPSYQGGYTRKVAVAARFALEVMDHLLSHTLWKAAYRDALDKYIDMPPEEAQSKAAHEADSAVRLGLGTSAPKDLPAIMRSNEFNKFITTLYGFHNGVYNQLRDIGHQFGRDRNLGKATVAGLLTVVLPAVLGNYLTGRGPDDEEGSGAWTAKKSLIFAADTVPLLRSIVSAMEGGHDVQFSPVESVMQKGAKAAMEVASDKEDKDWLGVGLNAGEAAGLIAGVPFAHQLVKTLRYAKRVSEGKVENPNLWNAVVGGGR